MKRRAVLFVALACGVLVAAARAKDKDDEASEHAAAKKGLAKAKITLSEAVQAALKKVPGGKAVQAEMEVEGDKVEFAVEVIAPNGKHMETEVNAVTGVVGDVTEEKKVADDDEDDEKAEDAAAKASVTLLQAMAAAQKRVPDGKPFEASSEMENGKLVFSVEFLSGDKIFEAQVDPVTGKVIKVEEEKQE
jgi:uncharacterized membrane protein YkoI